MTNHVDTLLPRSRRWREGVVLGVTFLVCVLGGAAQIDNTLAWPPPVTYVVALASCAALTLRQHHPVLALAATTACGVAATAAGLLLTPVIIAPVLVAAYALAVRVEWRAAGAAMLVAVTVLIATTPLFGALSWQDEDLSWRDGSRLASIALVPLVAGILGHATRNRRAFLAAVEERAQRAEQSRDSEARRRVAEERVRIARELHDLVAHQITLANAQATVAAHLFDSRPEQARKNVGALIETTSNALDDLRATVGLLRQTGDSDEATEPTPGLARLDTLVGEFGRAGLEVTVTQDGSARMLPPGVDLTAYRIIQEALTNVAKHAGSGQARVGLVWSRNRVEITVANDEQSSGTTTSAGYAAPVNGAATLSGRSPGFGLIGMRERATAIGGELSAGRSDEGGFLVRALLPLPSRRVES